MFSAWCVIVDRFFYRGIIVVFKLKSMAGKRKRLSIKEKMDIINESEKSGLSTRKLAEKFKVGKTQVTMLLQNKEEIRSMFQEGVNTDQKRKFPKTEGLAVDQAVFNWFCKARNKNLPISGPIIQAKALEVAQCLGLSDFKASNGWLERFCRRHDITFKTICGESADVNVENVESWKEKLFALLKDYAPKDVFNADETGLYYRALPTRTYALKNDKCPGRKTAKQRITILFCANMEGEKEEPLIIGKSKNPRCFKGAHIDKLPLEWVSNKKAWMTADIMTTWLHKFDTKMKKQNRKVVLFLDNATSHSKIALDNVKLIFLPPNTTSHCQPLDQGIIQNFKMIYRSYFIKRLLTCIDSGSSLQEVEKSITLTNALIWITVVWRNLSPMTIKKCFAKAGFMCNVDSNGFEEQDNIPLAELFPTIKDTLVDLEQFALIDSNVPTESSELNISDCIEEIREISETIPNSELEEEELEVIPVSNISSLSEACVNLRDLENFFINENNFEMSTNIAKLLIKCESDFFKNKLKSMKQSLIFDYFKK